MRLDPEAGVADAKPTWRDMATVSVPAKTKRKTVIEKALKGMEYNAALPPVLRVLDDDAAHAYTVEWEQPPPRLKLG